MQRTGARDSDLGQQRRSAFAKVEIGAIDRLRPADAACDQRNRLCPSTAAGRAAFGIDACDGVDAQVAELFIEKAVVGPAAKFAVGRKTQTETLLRSDRVRNRGIFRRGQFSL